MSVKTREETRGTNVNHGWSSTRLIFLDPLLTAEPRMIVHWTHLYWSTADCWATDDRSSTGLIFTDPLPTAEPRMIVHWTHLYWSTADCWGNTHRSLYGSSPSANYMTSASIQQSPLATLCLQCFDARLGGWKGIWHVKKLEWRGTGVVICLERGANDLYMVQLMPLPTHHLLLQ